MSPRKEKLDGRSDNVVASDGGSESQERNPEKCARTKRDFAGAKKNSEEEKTMTMLAKKEQDMGLAAGAGNGRALTIADYEARIYLYKEQAAAGFIGIGRTLIEAREAGVVPEGQWENWVEQVAGMNIRQAQRCMRAAREIREGSFLGRIDMSKALILLGSGLNEDQQEELGRKAAEEGVSVRGLQEEIRKLKLDKVAAAGDFAQIKVELNRAQDEKKSLEEQLKATMDAYQARVDEETEKSYRRGVQDTEGQARREAQEEIRKEFQGKLEFLNSKLRTREEDIQRLQAKVQQMDRESGGKWDEGFQAGMNQAEEMAQGEIAKKKIEMDRLAGKLEEERKEWILQMEQMRADLEDAQRTRAELEDAQRQAGEANTEKVERRIRELEEDLRAAEEREARRARELAELKKEKAQAGMNAARGIKADGMDGLDLAGAVRAFIGAAGVLPQMGSQLAEMDEGQRGAILAQVDTVAKWVEGVRRALGVVNADVTVM